MALRPTPLAWYSKILHMHTYSPFLKALSEKMLESGHILEPFGKSWWAIDLEESARDVESPPPLCADLARPLSISPAARQLCTTDIYQYERRFPSHARSPRRGGFPRSYLTIALEYVTKFRTPRGFARTPTSLVGEECAGLCRSIGDFQGRGASSLVSYIG